ncbi:hypothetical protein N7450_003590 [Penicillium hetheringtonii]|uniref:Uncharacterized protein n=1 Tax=Penicillium hetheringtonii TaxID=911720 RepID=A0AAD6GZ68_9EURO|nr:hypothetical protein N7450_003590 [Penicillium hetheringtonii]
MGSNDVHTSIEKELQGCDEALFALRKFQRQHSGRGESVPDQSQSFTDEILKELVEIQMKLAAYSTALNTHNANIIRSSQEHVERTMKAFVEELRGGKREKSVIATKSLMVDEKEGWKQLRKELQDAGINSECFTQNFDMIYASLKESELVEDLPNLEDIPSDVISTPREGLSAYGYDQMKDMATNMASAWMDQISEYASSPRWNSISKQSRQALSGLKVQPSHVSHMFSKALGHRVDLVSCAEDGDVTSVLNQLKRGANINAESEGETAMSRAAANGHKEIVLLLFAKGADLEAVNHQGETAFVQAAKNGHRDIVEILLSHAESVATGRQGEDALKKAAENGHQEIVQLLLEHGINGDVLDPEDQNDNTALSRAARQGHENIVVLLLNHGVRIDVVNYWGETALYHAVAYGDKRTIHHLLKFDVEVDPRAEHRARENSRLYGWLKAEQKAREKGLLKSPTLSNRQSSERGSWDAAGQHGVTGVASLEQKVKMNHSLHGRTPSGWDTAWNRPAKGMRGPPS